jgi:hypothetical protein
MAERLAIKLGRRSSRATQGGRKLVDAAGDGQAETPGVEAIDPLDEAQTPVRNLRTEISTLSA